MVVLVFQSRAAWTKLHMPIGWCYSQVEKLTTTGFKRASLGYRTAVLPIELEAYPAVFNHQGTTIAPCQDTTSYPRSSLCASPTKDPGYEVGLDINRVTLR